jgi:hypothetical protein
MKPECSLLCSCPYLEPDESIPYHTFTAKSNYVLEVNISYQNYRILERFNRVSQNNKDVWEQLLDLFMTEPTCRCVLMCALSLPLCENLLGQRWQTWDLVSSTVTWLSWSFSCSRRLGLLPNSRPHCNQTYIVADISSVRTIWNSCLQPSMWNWLTLVTY